MKMYSVTFRNDYEDEWDGVGPRPPRTLPNGVPPTVQVLALDMNNALDHVRRTYPEIEPYQVYSNGNARMLITPEVATQAAAQTVVNNG